MKISTLKVSPMQAETWLQQNTGNRNLPHRLVDDLARAMANGQWALNGESVKRAQDGTLLDGQHRLEAIVKAGVTVEMLVIEDLDPSAQDTMDTGRKRTAADQLAIHGHSNTNVLSAVAKRIWMWEQGNHKFANFTQPSTLEILALVAERPSLHRSAEIGMRVNNAYPPAGATVTGVAHQILLGIHEGDCAEFFAQLETGAHLDEGSPVLALRTRLMKDRVHQKRVPIQQGVAIYFRAWNAMRENRTLGQIIQPVEANMPMPI